MQTVKVQRFLAATSRGARLQKGATMIEVLVAVLVLAIGLLGLAGMQSFSLAGGMASLRNVQAQSLTQDLIDRMLANPSGNYEIGIPAAAPGTNCVTASCSPDQLAAFDLWEWSQHAMLYLPQADFNIVRDAVTNEVQISIAWVGSKETGAAVPPCTSDDNEHSGCLFTAVRI